MADERPLRIGVLALQGGVAEHLAMLRRLGAEAVEVRLPAHLEGLDGIILPGGESTTIGTLLVGYGLLASDLGSSRQPVLGVMDIGVRRNAFGSQLDSFERDLAVAGLEGGPFRAVFIRAPAIEQLGAGVEILAVLADGTPVAVQQGRLLASAFHPELGEDARIHRMFLELCRAGRP